MLSKVKRTIKHAVIRMIIWRERRAKQMSGIAGDNLIPEFWGCRVDVGGALEIEGVSVVDLASQYGTPLHVLNKKQLLATYHGFLSSFQQVYPNVILASSYKTNPLPYVLKCLHEAGSHAEVISHFELWLAKKLGVPGEKIIVNGPGKGDDALRLAVETQVQMINIDGPWEIEKIAAFARAKGTRQRVGVRVVTSVGWSSQFGLNIRSGAAEAAFRKILEFPELIPAGLHLHLGTGIQDVETYVVAVQEVIDFSKSLHSSLGVEIDFFDFGGGFGVPTVRGMTDWDNRMIALGYPARAPIPHCVPTPRDYAAAVRPLLDRLRNDSAANDSLPTVVFEPGRAITSSSQTLLLKVVGRKRGHDDKAIVVLDGGKNITMPLGWETHQFFPANRMHEAPMERCNLVGPLCHPGDVVLPNQLFPELQERDLIAIMDAGAYFIPNQMNFSNPRPAVVCVERGEHMIVRKRETFEEIIQFDQLSTS